MRLILHQVKRIASKLLGSIAVWYIPLLLLGYIQLEIVDSNAALAFQDGVFFQFILLAAILVGSIHQISNWLTDIPLVRRQSIGLILLFRSFVLIVLFFSYNFLGLSRIVSDQLSSGNTWEYFLSSRFLSMLATIVFVDMLYAWFYQFRTLIGRKTFGKLLIGRYRKPQTETRIFMFIDMKDSTTHAEVLGHVKFTELIQECFKIFGFVALKREVDIYQYVGDEVIVSWYEKDATRNNNCLHLYFDFREKLLHNSDRLMKKFGLVPVFKAGAHIGEVTVAEIGLVKRGIEYLSDVLNTAARIQGMCNHYQTDFLISGELKSTMGQSDDFSFDFVENVQLKGKIEKVDLFKLSREQHTKK